jgi:hypothetical protein
MSRFLRPSGSDTWDVYLDGEVVGSVRHEVVYDRGGTTDDYRDVYRAVTTRGGIPMPNGSVLGDGSWEKREEPLHETAVDAARCVVHAVETGRILNAQIAYERAHGWSTD